jgi:O-antigen/teichoic acid export membrane protein
MDNHTVLTNTISIVIVILIKAIIGVIIVMYITRNKQQVRKIKSSIR